jgi:hypothetical protein
MVRVNSPTNRIRVREAIAGMITLRSGYLRVSRSSVEGAGLGLWCCRTIPLCTYILYGGCLVDAHIASNTHSRHTGVPGMLMDGARFARCFDKESDDWRILPSIELIAKEFPEYQQHQHAAIETIILDTGIAYMVNPYSWDNVVCAPSNCKSKSDQRAKKPTIIWYDVSGVPAGVELIGNFKQSSARNSPTL